MNWLYVAYHLIWKALHTKRGKHHLYLKPLQIQNLKIKNGGNMAYYVLPTWKSEGGTFPVSPTKLHPCIQPVMNKDLDLCQKHAILFHHIGTRIQRSQCMQHATAHCAFRAVMKLTAFVDRAGTTNLMFSKIWAQYSFDWSHVGLALNVDIRQKRQKFSTVSGVFLDQSAG